MADLAFDPSSVLMREPGALIEPHFLTTLYSELEVEHGVAEAAITLLQIGFLHGLKDARHLLDLVSTAPSEAHAPSTHPQLAIQFQNRPPPPGLAAAIELQGRWPDAAEATAYGDADAGTGGVCFMSAGYSSGWFSEIHEADMLVVECTCRARGDATCSFIAREAETWRAVEREELGDSWENVRTMLDSIPFARFRSLVEKDAESMVSPETPDDAFDPDSAVIHIWGPVMVVPYSGTEEALQAVGLIGRDPGASEVSVVILDLTGTLIDGAFGAAALDQIVESIEAWGAEAVFAGLGPQSERVITDLSRPPIAVHEEVQQAIVAGFQIAEAQRRTA